MQNMKGRRVYESKRFAEEGCIIVNACSLYAVGAACTGGGRIVSGCG